MRYDCIEVTSLFNKGLKEFKFSRGGVVSVRIPWVSILWGGAFFVITGLISLPIISLIGGFDSPVLLAMITVTIFGATLSGAKLALWSPIKKETGEDLTTYFKILVRERLLYAGVKGKVSTTRLNSRADNHNGRIVECTQWLGTQPLTDAPPMSAEILDYTTPVVLYPLGEFVPVDNSYYDDGLGDRTLA